MLRFCWTPFLKNTYEGLYLEIYTIYIEHVLLSIYKYKVIFMKTKISIKSVFLIISHTEVSKLYFYKCTPFLLFFSLSTVIIRQFHSYAKILTLIPLIPTLIPCIPRMLTLNPRIPTFTHWFPSLPPWFSAFPTWFSPCHHPPHSVPRFPIPAFTDSHQIW